MMQMQMYAATAAAEAAGDHAFGERLRAAWERMWDEIHIILGADQDETTSFFAFGMLINTLASLGFPPDHRVWSGFYLSTWSAGREDGTLPP